MLEEFFSDARAIARHRAGVFGAYIDSFAASLGARGYTWHSVRIAVWAVGRLGRWLDGRGLPITAVSEKTIVDFRATQRQPSWHQHGGDAVLHLLLSQLRSAGVTPEAVPPPEPSAADQLAAEFATYLLDERSLSETTAVNYCPEARRLLSDKFGTGPIDLAKLCVADLHAFVARHARDYCARRMQLMLCALRSFLRFLYVRGDIPARLDPHVPTAPSWRKTQLPKYLSDDEIARVLASCDRRKPIGQRDYAILLLLARLGLRAGEVVSLELNDIRWEAGEVSVCGKGGQRKRFPLFDDVGEALAAYLKNVRRNCDSRRVFLRAKAPYRGLGSSSTLDTIVEQALLRAGLDPPMKGAHLFRHSLATKMLRHGATLTEIGQILHHTNPDTTSIYAKVDISGLRALA
jgi:site-specific recombinase XerD